MKQLKYEHYYTKLLLRKVYKLKRIPQLGWLKEIRRRKLIKACVLYKLLKRKERKEISVSRTWVRPIFTEDRRYEQGASHNLIIEMINKDPDKYIEYMRMDKDTFNELLRLIEPNIQKQNVVRTSISAITRLEICIRYLASGDSMHSLSFAFRVATNTISKIVSETCQAIWHGLKDIVFPECTEDLWKQKAKEFEDIWDFPNCIGAIDGKHVGLKAPPRSGSTFYNYKNMHSIVLMALADANYRFTVVDIGAEGRRSDGGIFQQSVFRNQLEHNSCNLPKARFISKDGPKLPYVIIGDEAFALTPYMLRPYPRKSNLNVQKRVFNYRLSRARRVVECAFGILTSRWRILRKPIEINVNSAVGIVQATICLHNLLITRDLARSIEERQYLIHIPPQDINSQESHASENSPENIDDTESQTGSLVRDLFLKYFCTSGAIQQQWAKTYTNDY